MPESQIELTIELLRQDDLGALIVRLEAEGDDVAELIDADAQLFSAPPEAAPSLAQPFASAPLDADHSATFTELELNETVYLLVRLARSAPLLLTIEASWWPA